MNDPMMDMSQDPMSGQGAEVPMDSQGMEGGFENQMNPEMGGDPNAFEDGNQFDTNFDAGVEADEDTDPKRYIQQLTGKLSQTLNKYNNEQEAPDESLSKYVGKMIVKQVAKALDDAGKKDLIKSINTTESDDENFEDDVDIESGDNMGDETFSEDPQMNEPIQECRFTKKELIKLKESINNELFGDEENLGIEPKETNLKKNNPFSGKKFNK